MTYSAMVRAEMPSPAYSALLDVVRSSVSNVDAAFRTAASDETMAPRSAAITNPRTPLFLGTRDALIS